MENQQATIITSSDDDSDIELIDLLGPVWLPCDTQSHHQDMGDHAEPPEPSRPDLIDLGRLYYLTHTDAQPKFTTLMHASFTEFMETGGSVYGGNLFGREQSPTIKLKASETVYIKYMFEFWANHFTYLPDLGEASYKGHDKDYALDIRHIMDNRDRWSEPKTYLWTKVELGTYPITRVYAKRAISKHEFISLAYGKLELMGNNKSQQIAHLQDPTTDLAYYPVPDYSNYYTYNRKETFCMIKSFDRIGKEGRLKTFTMMSFLKYATVKGEGNVQVCMMPVSVSKVKTEGDVRRTYIFVKATKDIAADEQLFMEPFWIPDPQQNLQSNLDYDFIPLGRQSEHELVDQPEYQQYIAQARGEEFQRRSEAARRASNISSRTRSKKKAREEDEKDNAIRQEKKRSRQDPLEPAVLPGTSHQSDPCSHQDLPAQDLDRVIEDLVGIPTPTPTFAPSFSSAAAGYSDPCHPYPLTSAGIQTSHSLMPCASELPPVQFHSLDPVSMLFKSAGISTPSPLDPRVLQRDRRRDDALRQGESVLKDDEVIIRNLPTGRFPTIERVVFTENDVEVVIPKSADWKNEWKRLQMLHFDKLCSPFMGLKLEQKGKILDWMGLIVYDREVYLKPLDAKAFPTLPMWSHNPPSNLQLWINVQREHDIRASADQLGGVANLSTKEVKLFDMFLRKTCRCDQVFSSVDETTDDLVKILKEIQHKALDRVQYGNCNGVALVIIASFSTYLNRKVVRKEGEKNFVDYFKLLHDTFGPKPSRRQVVVPITFWGGSKGNQRPTSASTNQAPVAVVYPAVQGSKCGVNEIVANINCLNDVVRSLHKTRGVTKLARANITQILSRHQVEAQKLKQRILDESDMRPIPTFLVSGGVATLELDVMAFGPSEQRPADPLELNRDTVGIHIMSWRGKQLISNISAVIYATSQLFKTFGLTNGTKHIVIRTETQLKSDLKDLVDFIIHKKAKRILLALSSLEGDEEYAVVGDDFHKLTISHSRLIAALKKKLGQEISFFVIASHPNGDIKTHPVNIGTFDGKTEIRSSGCRMAVFDLCEQQSHVGLYKGKTGKLAYVSSLSPLIQTLVDTYVTGLPMDLSTTDGCISMLERMQTIVQNVLKKQNHLELNEDQKERTLSRSSYGAYTSYPTLSCSLGGILTDDDSESFTTGSEVSADNSPPTPFLDIPDTPASPSPTMRTRKELPAEQYSPAKESPTQSTMYSEQVLKEHLDVLCNEAAKGIMFDNEDGKKVMTVTTSVAFQVASIMEYADPRRVISTHDLEKRLTIQDIKQNIYLNFRIDERIMSHYFQLIEEWSWQDMNYPPVIIINPNFRDETLARMQANGDLGRQMDKKKNAFIAMIIAGQGDQNFFRVLFPVREEDFEWSLVVYNPSENTFFHYVKEGTTVFNIVDAITIVLSLYSVGKEMQQFQTFPDVHNANYSPQNFTNYLGENGESGILVAAAIQQLSNGIDPYPMKQWMEELKIAMVTDLLLGEIVRV